MYTIHLKVWRFFKFHNIKGLKNKFTSVSVSLSSFYFHEGKVVYYNSNFDVHASQYIVIAFIGEEQVLDLLKDTFKVVPERGGGGGGGGAAPCPFTRRSKENSTAFCISVR